MVTKPLLYTVKSGDSLSSIARDVLGNMSRWLDLMKLNPIITDPNKIYVGQVLTLPAYNIDTGKYLPLDSSGKPVLTSTNIAPSSPSPYSSLSSVASGGTSVDWRSWLTDPKKIMILAVGAGTLMFLLAAPAKKIAPSVAQSA